MENVLLLLPLASACFGAFSNVVAKRVLKDIDSKIFIPINFFILFLMTTPLIVFSFKLGPLSIALPLIVLIGLIDSIANYLFFTAVEIGEVSHVTPIYSLAPFFTILFASIFLPQQLGIEFAGVAAAVTFGVYVINIEGTSVLEPIKSIHYKRNYFALGSAVLFGLSAIPTKLALSKFGVVNPATLYWLRALVIGSVLFLLFRPDPSSFTRKDLSLTVFRDIFVILQWVLLFYSIMWSNVILAVALANTIPLFTLVFAKIAFDEEITPQKITAIMIIIAAITYLKI